MISVDNFYWVLYETLLKSAGLDTWYFFPWGTQDQFSAHEFGPLTIGADHVLFHYDQEPLWTNSLGKYDRFEYNYSHPNQYLCVLANSEHSDLKHIVCRERDMIDWYYFYHGFLALDWFRDSQYVGQVCEPSTAFCSLNHITQNHRAYRMALTARILAADLQHAACLSFHADPKTCAQEISDPWSKLSDQDKSLVQQYLVSNSNIPLRIDDKEINGALSAHFGFQEYRLWQQSLFHLVNETVFYESKLHLTEKIFKPIVAERPFILVAGPGNLAYLKTYGFQTFDQWIDESYDTEPNSDKRLDLIVKELIKIAKLTPEQLRALHQDMRDVLAYNKTHFFQEFKKIIVQELLTNFQKCMIECRQRRPSFNMPTIDFSSVASVLSGNKIKIF